MSNNAVRLSDYVVKHASHNQSSHGKGGGSAAEQSGGSAEPNSRGLVSSNISATNLKVGDKLDSSGKTRVRSIMIRDNVLVGTATRGSRGGGIATFSLTQQVKVWRKS